ncbi:hypothetical protein K0M31_010759 [Melipona bicolor]|uniref:Uncharacterized protein n=1 Tax=Melipona bicolor TaxID=60889 RepID=A0AA40KHX2_9HYME|nr:hypothetical protein K0M31_010759 [Melipona bicolor]
MEPASKVRERGGSYYELQKVHRVLPQDRQEAAAPGDEQEQGALEAQARGEERELQPPRQQHGGSVVEEALGPREQIASSRGEDDRLSEDRLSEAAAYRRQAVQQFHQQQHARSSERHEQELLPRGSVRVAEEQLRQGSFRVRDSKPERVHQAEARVREDHAILQQVDALEREAESEGLEEEGPVSRREGEEQVKGQEEASQELLQRVLRVRQQLRDREAVDAGGPKRHRGADQEHEDRQVHRAKRHDVHSR